MNDSTGKKKTVFLTKTQTYYPKETVKKELNLFCFGLQNWKQREKQALLFSGVVVFFAFPEKDNTKKKKKTFTKSEKQI